MRQTKAQSSLEFISIFAIGFLITLAMAAIFVTYSFESKEMLDRTQTNKIFVEIIENSQQIYFLGQGNRITLNVKLPQGIENLTIEHRNISDRNNPGQYIQYDFINVSFTDDSNRLISIPYETNQIYIRLNCSIRCLHTANNNGNWTSYFNETSDFSGGARQIRIESKGDYIDIGFHRD